MLFFCNKHYYL